MDGSGSGWQQNSLVEGSHPGRLLGLFLSALAFATASCLVGWLVVLTPLTPLLLASFIAGGVIVAMILRNKLYGLILFTAVSFINTSFLPVLFAIRLP